MVVVLKGMDILIDGKIVNRYVYRLSSDDHYGLIRIGKGYCLVIKSANPLEYQWVATEWSEIGDRLAQECEAGNV